MLSYILCKWLDRPSSAYSYSHFILQLQMRPTHNRMSHRIEPTSKKKTGNAIINPSIYEYFLTLYQEHPNAITDCHLTHQIQQLYELVRRKPQHRTSKTLKKISSEIAEFRCFKPRGGIEKKEILQIYRRNNLSIISMISSFLQMTRYLKGSVIETTSIKRTSIKILLTGQIVIFEPINSEALKKCQTKVKNNEINIIKLLCNSTLVNTVLSKPKSVNPEECYNQQKQIKTQNKTQPLQTYTNNDPNTNKQIVAQNRPLTKTECKTILSKLNIISHRPSKYEPLFGDFVADKKQTMFVELKPEYESTAICATTCIFLEIGEQIARQVINLIKDDDERPFIQALLTKFPMLEYFEARQYVNPDYIMFQEEKIDGDIRTVKSTAKQLIKEEVPAWDSHELSYTGDIYLIVTGSVTLTLSQVAERRVSVLDLVKRQVRHTSKQLLCLYENDMFGFEEIGKQREVGLRYVVGIGSKILRLDRKVLTQHGESVEGLAREMEEMAKVRNHLISTLVKQMESSLETQEVDRFRAAEVVAGRVNRVRSVQRIQGVREVKFYGNESYESATKRIKKRLSHENDNQPKQPLSPEIASSAGLGLEFASRLIKKDVEDVRIKDGMIEIRNRKGTLISKKKLNWSCSKQESPSKNSSLLRQIGVLDSKDIAEHNLSIMRRRGSEDELVELDRGVKQMKRLKKKSQSVPKLSKFFAKRQAKIYQIFKHKIMQ